MLSVERYSELCSNAKLPSLAFACRSTISAVGEWRNSEPRICTKWALEAGNEKMGEAFLGSLSASIEIKVQKASKIRERVVGSSIEKTDFL